MLTTNEVHICWLQMKYIDVDYKWSTYMLNTNEVHICWIPVKYMLLNMWMFTENKTVASFNFSSENQSWLLFLSFLILLIEWSNLSIRVWLLEQRWRCIFQVWGCQYKGLQTSIPWGRLAERKKSLLRVVIRNMEVCGSQRLIWKQPWF